MENNSFEAVLTKVVSERGLAIFDNPAKCNGLLQDYANGGCKREIRLLLQALEAGYHKTLLGSADPEITIPMLAKKFNDEYGTAKEVAVEIIGILAKVLKECGKSEEDKTAEKITKLEKAAKDGDIQAQYNLGVLLRNLKRFEEASGWLELGMKKVLELYAEEKQKSSAKQKEVKETPQAISPVKTQPVPRDMVLINNGTFMMGSPDGLWLSDNEYPQHQVTVSSFFLGKYEVTQKEWCDVMKTTISQQRGKVRDVSWWFNVSLSGELCGIGDTHPMYFVHWYEAIEYCNKRSFQEGLTPAYTIDMDCHDPNNTDSQDKIKWLVTWNRKANGYRLPTEAEWEYACRAGTTTRFYTGDEIDTSQANYDNKYWNDIEGVRCPGTAPVGSFKPNARGLYDMYGNVQEWCWDWYGQYTGEKKTDPTGAVSGNYRCIRGEGWDFPDMPFGSAARDALFPSKRLNNVGFRLARNAE
jgi:formylglycine-generating enzyme required for sulfatase activity